MSKQKKHIFVILTPTYQRVNTLPRLYESLCNQTFKDFLWLIIDDGSDDGTNVLVSSYIKEKKIDIEYHWKENGGKHTTFWEALKFIDSDTYKYIITADSDDTITERALEIYLSNWSDIEQNKLDIGYVKARCVRKINGRQFPYKTPDDNAIDTTYQYVTFELGDFCEYDSCTTIDVFKDLSIAPRHFWLCNRAHFNYFPEGVLWARAGKKVNFRYIPDVTRVYYEDTGNSLIREKSRTNYNRLFPRLVYVKYILSENFSTWCRFQKRVMLEKMVLYVCCWYLLDVKWKECYIELDNRFLRAIFVLLSPLAPVFSKIFKKRL